MKIISLRAVSSIPAVVVAGAFAAHAAEGRALPAPNYELASRWMPSKVGKLVFDTGVTPRWAETSDRFFYSFETAQGRTFHLVDPLKRTKGALWDNAKVAAMLTKLTRVPFDSQHLPMGATRPAGPEAAGGEPPRPPMLKWAKNDTAIQFEIEVPKDAKIPGEKPPAKPEAKDAAAEQSDKKEASAGERDTEDAKTTKTLYFEYEIATGKLSILHDFIPEPKKPAWAQISPDDKTVIFARGHNLFMMDAESYKLALADFGDPKVQEVQITTDGVEHYSFARRMNEQARTTARRDQKGDDKHKDGPRVPAIVLQWAKDSTKFSGVRQDLRKVADLWVINSLADAGFKFPEPFKVKADDGVTDLFGVMYRPFDFDPAKRYPIIAFVYPGPQTESVTKTFSPRSANVALANMGFIVIEVGNRGGHPQRSKWYHNYGYGNLRDYGLADKKAAIEQLARKNPWIDMDLVGIYGHSGGGFMSTAAMLVYPDFFKVAVSSSGNHENNVYNRAWSEKHHGVKEVTDKDGKVKFEYGIDRNSEFAKNLKGHLFLVTGDQDDNVHPAGTLRMADALIKAHKRFDFFVMTGQRHGFGPMTDYFFWLRADYFAKHLLGRASESVDLVELAREAPQNGKKHGGGGAPEGDR